MTASTPTLIKTKAETAYAEQFEQALTGLPGDDRVRAARRAAMATFAGAGLPHRRLEEWKYTDLRTLVKDVAPATGSHTSSTGSADLLGPLDAATFTFVDGRFVAGPEAGALEGVTVETLAASLARDAGALALALPDVVDRGSGSIAELNAALASDGVVVHVAAGARPARALHLKFVSTGGTAVRNRIVLGAGSEAVVIESHVSASGATRQENAVTALSIADDAVLHHATASVTESGTVALGHIIADLGRNAILKPFQLTLGEGVSRQQVTVAFDGEASTFDFGGVTLARGNGHGDTTITVHHKAPHCTSRELFKTVLDGNGRAVFQGKVIVDRLAQKTDGKQMARALLLSPTAEFDSKPELEIFADDVACGHGSTCAEIDPDLIFYCRSRGIPEAEARALLIESFVGEAIDKIDDPLLRRAFSGLTRQWFGLAAIGE